MIDLLKIDDLIKMDNTDHTGSLVILVPEHIDSLTRMIHERITLFGTSDRSVAS